VAVLATAALSAAAASTAAYGYGRLDAFTLRHRFEALERLRRAVAAGEPGADQVEWLRSHWQHAFAGERLGDYGAGASTGALVGAAVLALVLHAACAVLVAWPVGGALRASSLPTPPGLAASVILRTVRAAWWRLLICGAAAGLAYGAVTHLIATTEDASASWPWAVACVVFVLADAGTLLGLAPRSLAALAPAAACGACGYAGVKAGGTCPECGRGAHPSATWTFPWRSPRPAAMRAALLLPQAWLAFWLALLLLSIPGAPGIPGALGERLRLSPGTPADHWTDARIPPSVRDGPGADGVRRALLVTCGTLTVGIEQAPRGEGGPPVTCRRWHPGGPRGGEGGEGEPRPMGEALIWMPAGMNVWRCTIVDTGSAPVTLEYTGSADPFIRFSRPIIHAVVVAH